jgi:hypothetical protein
VTEWRYGRNPYGRRRGTWELVRFNDNAHLLGTPLAGAPDYGRTA